MRGRRREIFSWDILKFGSFDRGFESTAAKSRLISNQIGNRFRHLMALQEETLRLRVWVSSVIPACPESSDPGFHRGMLLSYKMSSYRSRQ
jgi:hypothetical protein